MRARAALSARGRAWAGRLVAAYLRLCWRTTRWSVVDETPEVEALRQAPDGFVAVFWHQRLAFAAFWRVAGRPTHAMISANRDGDVISACVAALDIRLIRGSSADPRKPSKDKRGREALAASLAAIRQGACVAIAVDGPRGPARRAKAGAAVLAAQTGAQIAPVACATRRARALRSWDRFHVPLPFDRGALVFGAPLRAAGGPDSDEAVEALRGRIDAALQRLTARADAMVGRADGAMVGRADGAA